MGKGQHTTTFAEMFELGDGTRIIDSPGIKTLSYNHLEIQDVAHNFREFFEISSQCKFQDCSHRNEPKCAVKEGLENGTLSELRYKNYCLILDEIEGQNYWERNSKWYHVGAGLNLKYSFGGVERIILEIYGEVNSSLFIYWIYPIT